MSSMGRGLAFIALLWVAACGDGPMAATNLALDPGELTLELGFERQFRVVRADEPESNPLPAVWTSSEPTVATVDDEGVATATGPGVAAITADVSGSVSLSAEVTVPPLVFASVSAGTTSTCGLTDAGTAYCWGNNRFGQLGDGTKGEHRLTPVPVAGQLRLGQVSARYQHACGLTDDGTGYCWGRNVAGLMGNGQETGEQLVPGRVRGGPFTSIHAGGWFTCALTPEGEAYCWGNNRFGSVGDGTNVDRNVPTPVAGGLTFMQLATAGLHACGLTADGTAHCWGRNDTGELGDSTLTDRSSPVPVVGDLRFRAISAGGGHTCGVSTENRVYCWGLNTVGELGDGTTEDRLTPTPVETDVEFDVVLAGVSQTCGLSTEGRAYCWGWNFTGSLGQPPEEVPESWVPVPVTGGHVFHRITHASGHSCGLATDGIVYCWGSNPWGELGIGVQTVGSYQPVPVFGQR